MSNENLYYLILVVGAFAAFAVAVGAATIFDRTSRKPVQTGSRPQSRAS